MINEALCSMNMINEALCSSEGEALCSGKQNLCARRRRSTELCLGSCGLAAGVRGEALCVGCGSSVLREAEALCTEEKKHRALPGVVWFCGRR